MKKLVGSDSENIDKNDISKILIIFYCVVCISFAFCFLLIAKEENRIKIAVVEKINTLMLEEHIPLKYNYFLGFSTPVDKIIIKVKVPHGLKKMAKQLGNGYYCVNYGKHYYDTNEIKYELIGLTPGECRQKYLTNDMH